MQLNLYTYTNWLLSYVQHANTSRMGEGGGGGGIKCYLECYLPCRSEPARNEWGVQSSNTQEVWSFYF